MGDASSSEPSGQRCTTKTLASEPDNRNISTGRWGFNHSRALATSILAFMTIWAVVMHEEMGLSRISAWSEPRLDYSSYKTLSATQSAAGRCPKADELGYWSVRPAWDSENEEKSLAEADWRVRHAYHRQHPEHCEDANYLLTSIDTKVGFGATVNGFIMGAFSTAYRWGRVFMVDEDRSFGDYNCATNKTGWDCYFEPLTHCTPKDIAGVPRGGNFEDPDTRISLLSGWRHAGWEGHKRKVRDFFQLGSDPGLGRQIAGLLLYLLRLNPPTRHRIEAILQEAIPCDFDPRRTIAMPIRASDKCMDELYVKGSMTGETNCLSFDLYMELAETIRKLDPMVDTIILTSEDKRFVEARKDYMNRGWRFITNPVDVMQMSGTITDSVAAGAQRNHTMDEVFLSYYSSLQMQLRGQYVVLNCISHFHGLIRTLLEDGGVGFVQRPHIICLDQQDSKFMICNAWSERAECEQKRNAYLAAKVRRQLRRHLRNA